MRATDLLSEPLLRSKMQAGTDLIFMCKHAQCLKDYHLEQHILEAGNFYDLWFAYKKDDENYQICGLLNEINLKKIEYDNRNSFGKLDYLINSKNALSVELEKDKTFILFPTPSGKVFIPSEYLRHDDVASLFNAWEQQRIYPHVIGYANKVRIGWLISEPIRNAGYKPIGFLDLNPHAVCPVNDLENLDFAVPLSGIPASIYGVEMWYSGCEINFRK